MVSRRYSSTFLRHIKTCLSNISLGNQIHPIFYITLLLIRAIQCLTTTKSASYFVNLQILIMKWQNSNISSILIMIFLLFLTTMIILNLFQEINLKKHKVQNLNFLLKKIIFWSLLIARYLLIIPIANNCFQSFMEKNGSQKSLNKGYNILNFIIYFGMLYPITGISFWNKIVTKRNLISYVHVFNLETLLYSYIPFMILFKTVSYSLVSYVNVVFCIGCMAIIHFRPLITFNYNNYSTYGCLSIVSILLISSMYKIFQIQVNTIGELFLYLIVILVIVGLASEYMLKRITKILLNIKFTSQKNELNLYDHEECLFYNVINYGKRKKQLTLLLINNLYCKKNNNQLNQDKTKDILQNKNIQNKKSNKQIQSTKTIEIQQSNQLLEHAQKLLEILKSQNSSSDQQAQNLFLQLSYLYFKQKYDSQILENKSIGKQEISKHLFHSNKTFIFMSQIQILKQKGLIKAYHLIKNHVKLLQQVDQHGFFQSVQINILLLIIQKILQQQSASNKDYNLKAQIYLQFSKNIQNLKLKINNSSSTCLQFWQQIYSQQPDSQKIQSLIEKNQFHTSKVFRQYKNILARFQAQCYLIVFQMILQYSEKVLNSQLNSKINPFYGILKKVSQQLEILKKQGADKQKGYSQQLYSFIHKIGVCFVDMENQEKQILWGNHYFWTECFDKAVENQNQKISNPSVYDMIFQELVKNHKTLISQSFEQKYQLNYKHGQTLLYKRTEKKVQQIQLEIQLVPSFKNGFKIALLINKIQQRNNKRKYMSIIMNQKYDIIAQSDGFKQEKQQMTILRQNQEICKIDQVQLSQILRKNNQVVEMVRKIQEVKIQKAKNTNLNCILKLQNSDYRINYRKKMKYTSNSPNPAVRQQQISHFLLQLQFINILNAQGQQNMTDPFQEQIKLKGKYSNFEQIKLYQSNNVNTINFQSNLLPKLKKYSSIRNENKLATQNQQQPFYDQNNESVYQKSEKILKLDKKLDSIITSKTPKRIFYWRTITIIIIILLNITMIINITISVKRKQVYTQKKMIIKDYNSFMTDTAQIIISLKQYNYYANVYGSNNERIPYYIRQLHFQQQQVSSRIKEISSYLKDKWKAYQFQPSGKFKSLYQYDYVVITNYVLSSITYLSRIDPSQMTFSFLMSGYNWYQGLTNTQVRFLESIYNGQFVCLVQMMDSRIELVKTISTQILPILKQLYIFPTMIGILLLTFFALFSIIIEIKSKKTKIQFYQYLNKIPHLVIKQKLKTLKDYSYQNKQIALQKVFSSITPVSCAIEQITKTFQQNSLQKDQIRHKNNSLFGNNLTEGQTNRQFMNNPITNRENNTDLQQKIQTQQCTINALNSVLSDQKAKTKTYNEKFNQTNLGLNKIKYSHANNFWKICFYLLICTPFFIYFVTIFVGGLFLNQKIMQLLNISSQLYNRKTKFQYDFLFTRQTALYQPMFLGQMDWTALIINSISQTYVHQRKVQNLVSKLPFDSNLKIFLNDIANANLCNYVNQFTPSLKYNITFTYDQCTSFSAHIFTQGLKPTIVYYLENAIQILTRTVNPGNMTYQQRIDFIESNQIKRMKFVLAYLQQILDRSMVQFQKDINSSIDGYVSMTVIYSSISAVAILLILVAIHIRWRLMMKQKNQINSILSLISYKSIKDIPVLTKSFQQIDCSFYQ